MLYLQNRTRKKKKKRRNTENTKEFTFEWHLGIEWDRGSHNSESYSLNITDEDE